MSYFVTHEHIGEASYSSNRVMGLHSWAEEAVPEHEMKQRAVFIHS